MTVLQAPNAPTPVVRADDRWLARRRWARAGWLYAFMLVMSLFFLGPFLMGLLSSMKDDPNEYPPRLAIPQLTPQYLGRAYNLGVQGGGGGWNGGLYPGHTVTFDVSVRSPQGAPQDPPSAALFPYQPVSLVSIARYAQAKDFAQVTLTPTGGVGDVRSYRVTVRYPALTRQTGRVVTGQLTAPTDTLSAKLDNGQVVPVTLDTPEAQAVQYTLVQYQPVELVENGGRYYLRGPIFQRTPLQVDVRRGQSLESSTLPPSDRQNFGRSLAYRNVTPGILGYTFNNYRRAFNETTNPATGRSLFFTWVLNSFLYAFLRVVAAVVFCSLAGYALARLDFPGKNLIFFGAVLFAQMVPSQVNLISNYVLLKDLNLLNIWGLWFNGLVAAGGVFLMKQFFEGMPRELEESASIDGAGPFTTFWRVMLPQAGPALIALAITQFQGAWNDFFWPLVILRDNTNFTLTVGLSNFRELYGGQGDYGLILAGAILSAIPVIIVFVIFQRYFVDTGADSAVKG
ncbi:binding-protein-dependent transport system inner membrane protein [Deinococcus aerius]|uniref:Binding-protein-dependent transport system inner membrane protein n=1 Tax=Deinococcus aerius TaxID=200253 RepID=A0A2I9CY69_9DEIO|nr:carbohydrate ABC transporter permease [Deinococcus aerius]GBF07082.1 binding-protein-dependent transport system inner membrane protein [Deinococcus aerius]